MAPHPRGAMCLVVGPSWCECISYILNTSILYHIAYHINVATAHECTYTYTHRYYSVSIEYILLTSILLHIPYHLTGHLLDICITRVVLVRCSSALWIRLIERLLERALSWDLMTLVLQALPISQCSDVISTWGHSRPHTRLPSSTYRRTIYIY